MYYDRNHLIELIYKLEENDCNRVAQFLKDIYQLLKLLDEKLAEPMDIPLVLYVQRILLTHFHYYAMPAWSDYETRVGKLIDNKVTQRDFLKGCLEVVLDDMESRLPKGELFLATDLKKQDFLTLGEFKIVEGEDSFKDLLKKLNKQLQRQAKLLIKMTIPQQTIEVLKEITRVVSKTLQAVDTEDEETLEQLLEKRLIQKTRLYREFENYIKQLIKDYHQHSPSTNPTDVEDQKQSKSVIEALQSLYYRVFEYEEDVEKNRKSYALPLFHNYFQNFIQYFVGRYFIEYHSIKDYQKYLNFRYKLALKNRKRKPVVGTSVPYADAEKRLKLDGSAITKIKDDPLVNFFSLVPAEIATAFYITRSPTMGEHNFLGQQPWDSIHLSKDRVHTSCIVNSVSRTMLISFRQHGKSGGLMESLNQLIKELEASATANDYQINDHINGILGKLKKGQRLSVDEFKMLNEATKKSMVPVAMTLDAILENYQSNLRPQLKISKALIPYKTELYQAQENIREGSYQLAQKIYQGILEQLPDDCELDRARMHLGIAVNMESHAEENPNQTDSPEIILHHYQKALEPLKKDLGDNDLSIIEIQRTIKELKERCKIPDSLQYPIVSKWEIKKFCISPESFNKNSDFHTRLRKDNNAMKIISKWKEKFDSSKYFIEPALLLGTEIRQIKYKLEVNNEDLDGTLFQEPENNEIWGHFYSKQPNTKEITLLFPDGEMFELVPDELGKFQVGPYPLSSIIDLESIRYHLTFFEETEITESLFEKPEVD